MAQAASRRSFIKTYAENVLIRCTVLGYAMYHASFHGAHCMPTHGDNEGNSTRKSALSGDGVGIQRRLK